MRIAMLALAMSAALLPPFNVRATFDEHGISEPVDALTAEHCTGPFGAGFTLVEGSEGDVPVEGSPFFGLPTELGAILSSESGAADADLGAQEAAARRLGKKTYNELEAQLTNTVTLLAGKDEIINQVNQETLTVLEQKKVLDQQLTAISAKLEIGDSGTDILKAVDSLVATTVAVATELGATDFTSALGLIQNLKSELATTKEALSTAHGQIALASPAVAIDILSRIKGEGLKAALVAVNGISDARANDVIAVLEKYFTDPALATDPATEKAGEA